MVARALEQAECGRFPKGKHESPTERVERDVDLADAFKVAAGFDPPLRGLAVLGDPGSGPRCTIPTSGPIMGMLGRPGVPWRRSPQ